MLGRTTGAVLIGVEAHPVHVEVDLGGGLPTIAAVGLAGVAVREGIDRIRSALRHGGFRLPPGRVTVNLAPAEVRKQGASLDLPIAAALLMADEQVPRCDSASVLMAGELALDGTLRPVQGALSMALAAREAGCSALLVPRGSSEEAALVEGLRVVPLDVLADLAAFACGRLAPQPRVDVAARLREASAQPDGTDLADVRGQAASRRALEVAAAGGHHLLLSGPPGAGKSMLARRLSGILPPLAPDEALSVTRVSSAAGLTRGLVARRPFRAPHHGISLAGLTGGGQRLRPGEISLASHGVLFLDELTEFRRDVLEALRQPLEDGTLTVVRARGAATFPAEFSLVASMNPCPCGYHGSPSNRCDCSPLQIQRYRAKLSGPLLDRFDLVVEVPPVDLDVLASSPGGETSSEVRLRVAAARRRQQRRFGAGGPAANARMSPADLAGHATLDAPSRRLLLTAAERLGLSARGYDRVRRVARTLADLDAAAEIGSRHVAEALQYRHPDRAGSGPGAA